MTINAAQKATRRRAFGRRMAKNAGDLRIIAAGLVDGTDPTLLDDKEDKAFLRQVEGLGKLSSNLTKLAQALEKSE